MDELNQKTQKLIQLYSKNKMPKWKSQDGRSSTNHEKNTKSRSIASQESRKSEIQLPKLQPEGGFLSISTKYDCCAFVIHCPEHDNLLVTRQDNVLWLPFTPLPPNRSWKDGALVGFLIVMSGSEADRFVELKENQPYQNTYKCIQVLRLQLPQTLKFITRLIYYFELRQTQGFKCCQTIAPHLEWFPIQEIRKGTIKHLWGPELVESVNRMPPKNIKQKIIEYSLEEAFLYVPRDPPRNLEEDMLKSLHITEKDVERMYADFVEHCFPSFYQTFESFKCYMAKYGFERNDARLANLFRAFNYNRNGFLSFHEFMLGLACMEPNTQHGEYRVRFCFRYYDSTNSGSLSEEEMKKLLTDIHPHHKVERMYAEALATFNTIVVMGKVRFPAKEFIAAVGSHKFRGTSVLCRSSKAIFAQISRSIAMKNNYNRTGSKKILKNVMIDRKYNGICRRCKEKKYEVASHLVRMFIDRGYESQRLPQIAEVPKQGLTAQKYSIECIFNKKSAANVTIQLVREFNANKGDCQNPKGLLQNHKEVLLPLLKALYDEVNILLEEEDKCQKVYSPCYIMGDIHGNLEDLLSLEKALWKQLPCVGSNYLFLGDYVDRGQWGLECALYLVAFKILCPNKVTMLRGNHEVRELQAHYTYRHECIIKYGKATGLKVWEMTNRIFDKLPVSALVDEAIYCAHGGIPKSAKTVQEIAEVKRELVNPEEESDIAWEILWSDPCHNQQYQEIADMIDADQSDVESGFIRNTKRGTAFLFNEVGANHFLRDNGLTHIIRAHEVPALGYMFHFGNKCVTIFSCSHYCGNNNDCGCILADNQRLRVLQLDTVNNAPATD